MLGYGGMRVGGGRSRAGGTTPSRARLPSSTADVPPDIDGLVEHPLTLTYDELRALPAVHQVSDFHCVEGWGVDDVRWDGVRMQALMDRARPARHAKFVTFHSLGGIYRDSLSMAAGEAAGLRSSPTTWTACPSTPDHGLPLRLVMPRMFGYKGPKWLTRIEFRDRQDIGYWEQRGWRIDAWINA